MIFFYVCVCVCVTGSVKSARGLWTRSGSTTSSCCSSPSTASRWPWKDRTSLQAAPKDCSCQQPITCSQSSSLSKCSLRWVRRGRSHSECKQSGAKQSGCIKKQALLSSVIVKDSDFTALKSLNQVDYYSNCELFITTVVASWIDYYVCQHTYTHSYHNYVLVVLHLQVVATGMFYGPDAYFTSGWNIMDGSLVTISIIDLLMSLISESSPKIFGILRVSVVCGVCANPNGAHTSRSISATDKTMQNKKIKIKTKKYHQEYHWKLEQNGDMNDNCNNIC